MAWLYSICGIAATIHIDQEKVSYDLAPSLEYICESENHTYTIQTISQQKFIQNNQRSISFSYRQPACWFRFSINNRQQIEQLLFLSIPFALLDHIDLFEVDHNHINLSQAGDHHPYDQRQVLSNEPIFLLKIKANTQLDYYLRVQTSSPFSLPIFLYSADQFSIENTYQQSVIGLFYGVTIGLLFYNIFLWLSTQERRQVYYIVYLIFGLLYFLHLHGFLFRFWPSSPIFNNYSFYATINAVSIFGFLFVKEYLYSGEKNRFTAGYNIIAGLITVQALCSLVLPLFIVAKIAALSTFFAVVFILISVLFKYKDKDKNTAIVLLAWGALFVSAVYTIVSNFLGKGNILHAILSLHIGFAVQQILLSIGLANYVKSLKQASEHLEKEAHIARAENVAKSEFLARMSHEIRTPMNAVLGMVQLLEDTPLNAEQQQKINILHNSSKQLLALIDDILDIARIDANKMQLHEEEFDLHQLLDESLALFMAMAEQKQLRLSHQIAANVPHVLYGDSMRLRQVLNNLLSNAIKFTKQGSVQLVVLLKALEGQQATLTFRVEDTGIGLSAEQQSSLFKNFSQVDTSISRQYSGSGLGLAISKKLIELMQGSISVESELGRGAVFIVELPFYVIEQVLVGDKLATPRQTLKSFAQLNVLVAEDCELNKVIVSAMLQRLGVEPHIVSNGQEAVDFVIEHHQQLDLVFMDYEMPVLDGLSATQHIRAWEKQFAQRRVPIIALTAHVLPYYEQLGKEAGINKFLTKPLMLNVLEEALAEFFVESVSVGRGE